MPEAREPVEFDPEAVEDLRALLERSRGGDRGVLPALRQALDHHPEIWRRYGDLAGHAEQAWIDVAAGPDLLLKESLARRLAELKAGLAGPAPTPLERLLAERAGIVWLQLAYADAAAAQARDVSIKQALFALKRQESAHRRFLTALGALAAVRRLLPPAAEVSAPPRPYGAAGEVGAPAERESVVCRLFDDQGADGGGPRAVPGRPGRSAS